MIWIESTYHVDSNFISRWAKELERTLNDIAEVKEKLAFKTAWCRVLQKDLGITRWQIISAEVNDRVSELADHLQQALETTEEKIASGSTKGLQKARVSFEAFSSGERDANSGWHSGMNVQGAAKIAIPRPRECCRQIQPEVVNKTSELTFFSNQSRPLPLQPCI